MGNKFSRRRAVVDERYTRTQGLYPDRDVDPRKLRRLILTGQLAPCFPGADEAALELDECPICFLFYPSLNRSKCCAKGICTECYLQIKSPHCTRPTQCPFCKTASYIVEYRGAKTVEEKGVEQEEEQKVIEAKIRIRQKELHDEEQRVIRNEDDRTTDNVPERFRRNFSNLHGFTLPSNDVPVQGGFPMNEQDVVSDTASDLPIEVSRSSEPEIGSRQVAMVQGGGEQMVLEGAACLASQTNRLHGSSFQRLNRMDDFDLDLEEIMVMEAIWLSIQEQGQTHLDCTTLPRVINASSALIESSPVENPSETRTMIGRTSATSGLAGAIAALAERQATSSESRSIGPVRGNNVQESENDSCALHLNNDGHSESLNVNSPLEVGDVSEISIDADGEKTGVNGKVENGFVIAQNGSNGDQESNNWMEVDESETTFSPPTGGESRGSTSDLLQDHSSEAVEVGTSFSSSAPSDLPWEAPDFLPAHSVDNTDDSPELMQAAVTLPDTFEEQMMLAMALSLAEAQAQAQRQ